MSKNKLIWSLALFLIIITSLPIAYAQTFTGSRLFLIFINVAIVGVILFILQAFLIPQKNPKEQTAVWVAIIAGSLLIGWFFGQNGFIWQGPLARFFSIHILVNTFIIAVVAYFALGLLGVKTKITSPEGNAGYGILIFIGAAVWALGIANSYGNVFIWQAYSYFISYFIGPEGILNPYPPQYRLMVFTGSFVLLAFFFNNFLITGAGANQKVNYGLALILAMNMASSGVSVKSVIILGEIVFTIVLAKELGATTTKKYGFNWLLSAGLVGWASAAMTYGTEYQGFLATLLGPLVSTFIGGAPGTVAQPTSWGWWLKTGGIILAVMLLLGGGLLVIGRGEFRAMLRKRAWPLLLNKIKNSANEGILSWLPFLRSRQLKNVLIEGLLPTSIRKLRLLFQNLSDYILRIDIFHAKRYVMDLKEKTISLLRNKITIHKDLEKLRYELIAYRNRGVIRKEDGTFEVIKGWNILNKDIADLLINSINETASRFLIEKVIISKIPDPALRDRVTRRILGPGEAIKFDRFGQLRERILGALQRSRPAYIERLEAYGAHHGLRAQRLKLFDMFNLYGKFLRSNRFAKKGAEVSDGSRVANDLTEVSFGGVYFEDGVFIDDINKLKTMLSDPKKFTKIDRTFYNQHKNEIRKIDIKNIVDYNLQDVIGWMKPDWEGFLRDFAWGEYHEKSRVVSDYEHAWSQFEYDDDKIAHHGIASDSDSAIDLRALADPNFHYLGRFRFTNTPDAIKSIFAVNGQPFKNPFPTLTTRGMTLYIDSYIKVKEQDIQRAKNFIKDYPADILKGHATTEKTAGAFEEAERR